MNNLTETTFDQFLNPILKPSSDQNKQMMIKSNMWTPLCFESLALYGSVKVFVASFLSGSRYIQVLSVLYITQRVKRTSSEGHSRVEDSGDRYRLAKYIYMPDRGAHSHGGLMLSSWLDSGSARRLSTRGQSSSYSSCWAMISLTRMDTLEHVFFSRHWAKRATHLYFAILLCVFIFWLVLLKLVMLHWAHK